MQLYENDAQMTTEDDSSSLPGMEATTEDFGTMDIDSPHINQSLQQVSNPHHLLYTCS